MKSATVILSSAAGTPYLTSSLINFLGFTASGITQGSTAAAMMSTQAISLGGGVPSMSAGGGIAYLQSVGALGLGTPLTCTLVCLGSGIGFTIAKFMIKT